VGRLFERLYIGYLLFVPLGATVMATITYAGPADFMLFVLWLGGAVAVAIYAAFVGTYLVAPKVWWRALIAIIDGPLWLLAAVLALDGWRTLDLMTWYFVTEALAVYLAIAWRALVVNELPSAGIMLACIAVVCFACGWTLWPELAHDTRGALLFVLALLQSTIVAYAVVERDTAVRDADASSQAILAAIGLFHLGIGVGCLLRFAVL